MQSVNARIGPSSEATRSSLPRNGIVLSLLFCVCAGAVSGARVYGQPLSDSHAKVELITDPGSKPGQPIWTGVLFQLDPGWHIYWQNAGDSGEPPKIQWNLPAGFRAGAIRWPPPIRLGSGSVIDYGYEDQVLLMVPIEPLARSQPHQTTSIAATVKYVVCREICVSGTAHLNQTFPVAGQTAEERSRQHDLFQKTRAQLPKPRPANWKVSLRSDKDNFLLSVRTGAEVRSATFFPMEPNVIENSDGQVFTASGNGFRLQLRKSEQLVRPVSTLRGVVVLDPGGAYEISGSRKPQ
jgi:DsbC/DsbD-like thiol-disulfide interchange protein